MSTNDNELLELVDRTITTFSLGKITTAGSNVVAEAVNLLPKIAISKGRSRKKFEKQYSGLCKHLTFLGSTTPSLENLKNAFKINSYLLILPPLVTRSASLLQSEVDILKNEIIFSNCSDSIAEKEESAERVLAIVSVLSELDASRFNDREKDILIVSIGRFLRQCSKIPRFKVDISAAAKFIANFSKSVDNELLLEVLG